MSPFNRWYQNHFLLFDFVMSLVISAIGIALVEQHWTREWLFAVLAPSRQAIYSSVISTAASMLGFVLATVSIIAGFLQMPKFKRVRESDHHATLYDVFFAAVYALALLTVLGFVALFFDTKEAPKPILTYCVWIFCVISLYRVVRCIRVLKLVTSLTKG